MSSDAFTKKRWLKLSLRGWLMSFTVFMLCVAIFSILFVRRSKVEYPMKHQFAVSDPAFFGSAFSLANPVPVEGNKIELLQNGDAIFGSMLEAIRGAEMSVNFEAFLFESGKVGDRFLEALMERAQAGVKVRVLLDGLGSGMKLDNADVDRLKKAGCLFAYYHPTKSWRIDRINRRTHRRVLVVDGKVGFTGGVGFADLWEGNAQNPKNWRDIAARIEGPLVTQLQSAFQAHWVKCYGVPLTGPIDFPTLEAAGKLPAVAVASESFSFAPMALMQAVTFSSAVKTIYISNAYCAPSKSQVSMLVDAVKRGVQVRLLLPGHHMDQPLTKAAGRGAYGDLLKGGVEIFEYQPTMMHNKTMVVDGMLSVFGTSNFDARSAVINEEIDIAVYDVGFGQQMIDVFNQDLEKSLPYTLEDFKKRSLWERFTEWVMIPFHSQV